MATYKIEIIARLGKFHGVFFEATGAKVDPADAPAHGSVGDVWKSVEKEIESRGLDEDSDSIIFRGIAYDDFTKLAREVRMATY